MTREGGISWSEADAIDDYASQWERQCAREKDTDKSWMEVATDPDWQIGYRGSNWSFLDPVGIRYYLAAAMARHLILGTFVLDSLNLMPPATSGNWRLNRLQIEVVLGYIYHCIKEDAWNELDSVLGGTEIDLDEYLAEHGEIDIGPIHSASQEAIYYWTRVLATTDS